MGKKLFSKIEKITNEKEKIEDFLKRLKSSDMGEYKVSKMAVNGGITTDYSVIEFKDPELRLLVIRYFEKRHKKLTRKLESYFGKGEKYKWRM